MSENERRLSHVDAAGQARMVDVALKPKTERCARARATVVMKPETLAAIREGSIAKGAVLGTARLAGILAGKKTSELIPLCHPLEITAIQVDFDYASPTELVVLSEVHAFDRTGVEMEALTACGLAALTVYDMCKAIDRGMAVRDLGLLYKSGGKGGTWSREAASE